MVDNIKSDREIIFSPHCHDDLGMATANTLAAIKGGAGRVEGTVNGIGERAGNVALEEVAVALEIRQDYYQATSDIVLNETFTTSELVSRFSGISVPKNKSVIGGNAFAHESGIHQDGVLKNPETYEIITPELVGVKTNSLPLGKLSGRHAFVEKLSGLGFDDITAEVLQALFAKFKVLADKKQEVTDADIRALVAGTTVKNPTGFQFDNLAIVSNEDGKQTVTITMKNEGDEVIDTQATGSGAVEAAFNAIDAFFTQSVQLNSYDINAITEGIDAQAEVHVTVENEDIGTIFNASGLDFDVLCASAIAYSNANSLVQRENAGIITKKISEKANPEG